MTTLIGILILLFLIIFAFIIKDLIFIITKLVKHFSHIEHHTKEIMNGTKFLTAQGILTQAKLDAFHGGVIVKDGQLGIAAEDIKQGSTVRIDFSLGPTQPIFRVPSKMRATSATVNGKKVQLKGKKVFKKDEQIRLSGIMFKGEK